MNLALGIWLFALFVKLILAFKLNLVPDETYYWFWGQRLQLSYFDHPPFIAWLMALGHNLFPNFEPTVRVPGIILGHCSVPTLWKMLRPHFSEKKIAMWTALVCFSPLTGFSSVLLTPDTPLVFFWCLSLYFFLRATQKDRTRDWLLLGLSLGLGFDSKYTIVLFVPCCLFYLVRERSIDLLTTRRLLLIAIAGLLASLPVWIWNYQNDMASFVFQFNHGLGKTWKPR